MYGYVHHALKHVRGLDSSQYVPELTKFALAAGQSFQWASTACLFIRNEDDRDAAMSSRLRFRQLQVLESNEGLDPLYQMILDRHFGSSRPEFLHLLLTMLGALAYAQEPLALRVIVSLATNSFPAPSAKILYDDNHRFFPRDWSICVFRLVASESTNCTIRI